MIILILENTIDLQNPWRKIKITTKVTSKLYTVFIQYGGKIYHYLNGLKINLDMNFDIAVKKIFKICFTCVKGLNLKKIF